METPFPLGRKIEHDSRSRSFSFVPRAELPVKTKTWRRYGNVLNQGNIGSCTGNAMTHALNSNPLHIIGNKTYGQDKAVQLYSNATYLDEFPGAYPPEDTGSSGLAVCKATQDEGHIDSYRWGFGLDHTLQTLMHGPVLIGTWWHTGMFYPDINGFVKPVGGQSGGHEYLLVGVNVQKCYLIFQNSWSSAWGINGRFHMTFDDFRVLLADGGDAVLPVRSSV